MKDVNILRKVGNIRICYVESIFPYHLSFESAYILQKRFHILFFNIWFTIASEPAWYIELFDYVKVIKKYSYIERIANKEVLKLFREDLLTFEYFMTDGYDPLF